MTKRFHISAEPLDAAQIAESVSSPGCGAVTTFVGLVRDYNVGRRVLWLDYEAYEPLARTTFERIGAEASAHWPSVALAIHHRVGRIAIGEASVVIAAASAATRSSASSRLPRCGSTNTSREARPGSKARPRIPTTKRHVRRPLRGHARNGTAFRAASRADREH